MKFPVATALIFTALCLGAYVVYLNTRATTHTAASRILAECKDGDSHDTCYESLVPQLYPDFSVPQVFDVVREILVQDRSYQFCHVLGHKIGQAVVAQDPAHWRDAIAFNPPDNLCSNGYIHGVVGGRFRSEVLDDATIEKLIPDFSLACEPSAVWHPTSFDRAVCYHGMGHLYDFITNADVPKALSLCRATMPKDGQRVCIQGVFMQIYQPLEPDDYELIAQMETKPTAETVRQFCAVYKDPEYVGSCLEESWPLFRESILNGTGAETFCAGYPNAEESLYCWQGISAIVGRTSLADPAQAVNACSHFPSERQGMCFAGSAQAVIEENRDLGTGAVALCAQARGAAADECYASLAKRATSIFGESSRRAAFCALLPEAYRAVCG